MDESVCPECGRPHDPVARPARAGRLTALLLAAALLVVGAAAIAALLSDRGDSNEADTSSTSSTPTPENAMSEDPNELASAEDQLLSAGRQEIVAYVSGTSVVTVDLESGEVTTTAPEMDTSHHDAKPVDQYYLLIAGNRTFGISRADPSEIFLLTGSGSIAPLDGTWVAVVDRRSDQSARILATQFLQAFTLLLADLDPDTAHLLVPELGVLATPATGGTYLVNRETHGRVSEGRVVTATANEWVEQRCDTSLLCSTVVVNQDTGAEVTLPDSFNNHANNLTIASDGTRIVQWGTEQSQVFDVRDGSVLRMSAIPIDPHWVDPTTLAWLELGEESAQLVIADLDSASTAKIDLGLLGAPDPTDLGLAFAS